MKNEELKIENYYIAGFIPQTDQTAMCFAVVSETNFKDIELQIEKIKSYLDFDKEITKLKCIGSFDSDGGINLDGSFINDVTERILITKDASRLPQLLLDYINVRALELEIINLDGAMS
jgi:hypothetical protein